MGAAEEPPANLVPVYHRRMAEVTDGLLAEHHAFVRADNPFQRRARLLQALWRETQGLPIGERTPGHSLGSRLPQAFARDRGANLITEVARVAARREVAAKKAGSGQKIDEDRLWGNLLSSQTLAFNLFADLAADLGLASRVLRRLWPDRINEVTRVLFEHSPGRHDPKYTFDGTAFDVYVEHTTPTGGRGFVAFEVKYHEDLDVKPAKHRPRYDEVTAAMGCFDPRRVSNLKRKPLEQLWRDHMLAGSMLLDLTAGWESGLYVFLHPDGNEACRSAVRSYREILVDSHTFDALALEAVVDAIERETEAPWAAELRKRYFGWDAIAALGDGVKLVRESARKVTTEPEFASLWPCPVCSQGVYGDPKAPMAYIGSPHPATHKCDENRTWEAPHNRYGRSDDRLRQRLLETPMSVLGDWPLVAKLKSAAQSPDFRFKGEG